MDQFGDEVAAEVEGHERFEATDARAANENGGRSITRLLLMLLFFVVVVRGRGRGRGEGGDLVIVQFDDGGVDPNRGEELLHDVAHAAGGAAEDDDGVLGDEAPDAGLGGLSHVDGEGGGVVGGRAGRGGRGRARGEAEVDDVV